MKVVKKVVKKTSKFSTQANEYKLFSSGSSAVFILNEEEVLIRQGYYLIKLNFLTYRIVELLTTYLYQDQPCAYWCGMYYEFGEIGFKVALKDFQIEPLEVKSQKAMQFVQNKKTLYTLEDDGILQRNLETNETQKINGMFINIFSIKDKLIGVVGQKEVYEIDNGELKLI